MGRLFGGVRAPCCATHRSTALHRRLELYGRTRACLSLRGPHRRSDLAFVHTFVGTAHSASWAGLTPVFCDVRADTHTVDPVSVERLIGPATAAILGVHLWGRPCPIDELTAIAESRGLPLIFDAAHASGISWARQWWATSGSPRSSASTLRRLSTPSRAESLQPLIPG